LEEREQKTEQAEEAVGEVVASLPPSPAPLTRELSGGELAHEELRSLEDDMLSAALEVVGGTLDFVELDPDDMDKIPPSWIKKYGIKKATRRHRAAKAGWESAKDAPVGVKVATQFAVGSIKARSAGGDNRVLNVKVISFQSPQALYEEIEVDD